MSVENPNVIDFVSLDNERNIILTISDHLEWDINNKHLLLLQEKINTYLRWIESGDIYKDYPKANNSNITINLATKYLPNPDGMKFIEEATKILKSAGYSFLYQHLANGNAG